ncbi:hypothetical protein RB195_004579 [Necator americanus]|uniref:Uncharacterized protein n=1 Tax=Necator americanus TaxID=51031 RepID=A0ABR1BIS1_NECAM
MRTQQRKPATAGDRNPHLESGIEDQTRPCIFYADQMRVQRTVLSTIGCERSLEENRGAKEKKQDREQETPRVPVFPPIPFPALLYKPQEANSVIDAMFRLFAMSVSSILSRYSHKRAFENLTPTQRKRLCELRDICSQGKIKISVSDKGGEFVVISSELDRAITKLHLTDDSLYHHSSAHELGRQYRRLNRIWTETARSVGFAKNNYHVSKMRSAHLFGPLRIYRDPQALHCRLWFKQPRGFQD